MLIPKSEGAMKYALYFPDDGRYSCVMNIKEAKTALKFFVGCFAMIVNVETAEVIE